MLGSSAGERKLQVLAGSEFRSFELAVRNEGRWTETLRCPKCSKTGVVSLLQHQGSETPTVQSISDGFKVVASPYGPSFHCETCNVAVVP
jgi:hypothetical protein